MYISILKENQSNETTKNENEDKTREGDKHRQMEKELRQGREWKWKKKRKLVVVKNCGHEDQEWKQGLSDRGAEHRQDN